MTDGAGNEVTESMMTDTTYAVNGVVSDYYGFTFIEGYAVATGSWHLEIRFDERVLIEQAFRIYEDDALE